MPVKKKHKILFLRKSLLCLLGNTEYSEVEKEKTFSKKHSVVKISYFVKVLYFYRRRFFSEHFLLERAAAVYPENGKQFSLVIHQFALGNGREGKRMRKAS